jgi:hypothetical protein
MKGLYAKSIIDALDAGNLRFMENCICANPFKNEKDAFPQTKNELHSQMSRARWISNTRTVDTGFPVASWSAKTGADGKISQGANDDIVVTLGMGIYWMNRIQEMNYPSVDYKRVWNI